MLIQSDASGLDLPIAQLFHAPVFLLDFRASFTAYIEEQYVYRGPNCSSLKWYATGGR